MYNSDTRKHKIKFSFQFSQPVVLKFIETFVLDIPGLVLYQINFANFCKCFLQDKRGLAMKYETKYEHHIVQNVRT